MNLHRKISENSMEKNLKTYLKIATMLEDSDIKILNWYEDSKGDIKIQIQREGIDFSGSNKLWISIDELIERLTKYHNARI